MSWEDLNIKEKSDLMRLYISNGIMDLDSIRKHYNSFAAGGALPDHDPNNPYHYHDAEGNKVVISSEDWEANVGKPYFKEIEDAVMAEQAAYPEPEYEVNPAFMKDLNSSVAAARGQNGMINYVGYKNQLPQGYTINENGIIFDDKGQAYVQESYPQSTRFTYNISSPLQFTFNQGKPIERNVNFYPVDMDMRVKAPLPVDRVMDVNAERENAIKTIQDNLVYRTSLENILPIFEGGTMVGNTPLYYDFSSKNNHKEFIQKYLESITGTPVTFIKYNDDYDNIVELNKEQLDAITKNSKLYYDKLNREEIGKIKKDLSKASPNDFRTKEDYDNHVDIENKYIQSLSDYINSSDFYYYYPEDRPKPYKLSRKEAEKKAVISIGPLKKTKTFQEGGPIDNKSDWAKAHEVELALQQLGWDNPNNKLHSDYAAKDDEGYYAGYNLKPVTIAAKHPLWDLPDYQGKEDNPNINAYKDKLWENRKEREEAGKNYMKWAAPLAMSPLIPITGGLGPGSVIRKGYSMLNDALNSTALNSLLTAQSFYVLPNAASEIKQNFQQGEVGLGLLESGLTALDLWGVAKFMKPGFNAVRNIKFNHSEMPYKIIKDVQNATNKHAQRFIENQPFPKFVFPPELIEEVQPRPMYTSNIKDWFKYKDSPIKSLFKFKAANIDKSIITMNPLSIFDSPATYKGLVAHEAQHSFHYPTMPKVEIPTTKYYGPNPEFPEYRLIKPFEKAALQGRWEGSPSELLSEMAAWKYNKNILDTPYYLLGAFEKQPFINKTAQRFSISDVEAATTLDGLSRFGFFQEGGPIDNKSDWAKVHEIELALRQLGWDNPDNRLHSDYAVKDGDGYYAGYNLKPVTITAKHPLWDLPWYKDKKNNPNINRYKDQLYNNWKRHNEAGKEYLKRVAGGLSTIALPIGGAAGFILGVPDLATDFAEMIDKPSISNATELTSDAPTRYGTELDNALISVLESNRYTKPLAKILQYNDALQYIGAINDASSAVTGKSIIEHASK